MTLYLVFSDAETNYKWIVLTTSVAGACLATVGWMWTGRVNLAMMQSTNALHLLARSNENSIFALKEKVYPYIQEYENFAVAAQSNKSQQQAAPTAPHEEIEKLLGIYEQLSVAVIQGAADEATVREAQSLVFKRIYAGLKHHIDYCQKSDPLYFKHFEDLTCRWFPDLTPSPAAPRRMGILFDPLKNSK